MKNLILSIPLAFNCILKNKINFMLALVPIIIGVILYYLLGSWIFGPVTDWGKDQITQYISAGSLGTFVYYIVSILLSIVFFFIINWTFVLVVALLSSPFNDIISARIEKEILALDLDSLGESFKSTFSKIRQIFFNELKKVLFIIILTIFGLFFSLIPFLSPISLAIAAILLAVEFLDYSWSRHNFTFKRCLQDVRGDILAYLIAGWGFMFLMSIPIVNIFMLPFGISYFTVLWSKNRKGMEP